MLMLMLMRMRMRMHIFFFSAATRFQSSAATWERESAGGLCRRETPYCSSALFVGADRILTHRDYPAAKDDTKSVQEQRETGLCQVAEVLHTRQKMKVFAHRDCMWNPRERSVVKFGAIGLSKLSHD